MGGHAAASTFPLWVINSQYIAFYHKQLVSSSAFYKKNKLCTLVLNTASDFRFQP